MIPHMSTTMEEGIAIALLLVVSHQGQGGGQEGATHVVSHPSPGGVQGVATLLVFLLDRGVQEGATLLVFLLHEGAQKGATLQASHRVRGCQSLTGFHLDVTFLRIATPGVAGAGA